MNRKMALAAKQREQSAQLPVWHALKRLAPYGFPIDQMTKAGMDAK